MTTHTVHVIKQARPGDDELAQLWKLYHAAERVETRWCRNTVGPIAEELANTGLSREEKMFLLRAWQVLVDGHGGYARLMGAFDCYVYNVQDAAADHVAYKPKLAQAINDGNLFDVILEAYAESRETIEALKSGMEAMATIYDAQKVRIADLSSAIIAPGVMRCAGCGFVLTKNNINMSAGTITAGDSKTEPCPNGCGPLWPITWKENALESRDDSEKWFEELQSARKRIAELEARTLSVKLPDPSSKAFWGGTGKNETFYPSTYKHWVAEAIEQAGTIAQVAIEVK